MTSFSRVHGEALAAVFARMATTQPNLYLAFVNALREADRSAADAVVGEEDTETLLRLQGAARQLRLLLVLASAPIGPQRIEERTSTVDMPQV